MTPSQAAVSSLLTLPYTISLSSPTFCLTQAAVVLAASPNLMQVLRGQAGMHDQVM